MPIVSLSARVVAARSAPAGVGQVDLELGADAGPAGCAARAASATVLLPPGSLDAVGMAFGASQPDDLVVAVGHRRAAGQVVAPIPVASRRMPSTGRSVRPPATTRAPQLRASRPARPPPATAEQARRLVSSSGRPRGRRRRQRAVDAGSAPERLGVVGDAAVDGAHGLGFSRRRRAPARRPRALAVACCTSPSITTCELFVADRRQRRGHAPARQASAMAAASCCRDSSGSRPAAAAG
jgi:hypothetical protein